MVSIRMTTTKSQLKEIAVATLKEMRGRAISILARVGEEAVNVARNTAMKSGRDWQDQTGNLRSSIGYIICEDGRVIGQSAFPQAKDTATEGPTTGLNYATSLASQTKGLALVVVAGMKYAIYVADKGYDVLSSSQMHALKRIPELFEKQAQYDQNR